MVVYVEARDEIISLPEHPPLLMVQKDEKFIPHVLPVLAGSAVSFPNEDPFYHNVFSVVAGDRFDLGRYAEGERESDPFEIPGVVVVRCEIHPGMKAYIIVLETPLFTVPQEDGSFIMPDLPAGPNTLKIWHPERGTLERIVEVPDSGQVDIRIEL